MNKEEMWLLEDKWNGEKTDGFFADCERLKAGEPLAYIIGHVPFLHTTIFLDSHPLIPRPETEFWVEEIIKEINARSSGCETPIAILDLCAGSGCIGVAILKANDRARVDFAEIDTRHHPTIQKNIAVNSIDPSRTRIFDGDIYENVPDTYDFILSNPPYIDKTLNRVPEEVLKHEPHDALFGGIHGIEYISRIITESPQHLTHDGVLVIEHEPEQTTEMLEIGTRAGFKGATQCDQYGKERYTRFTRV